MFKALRLSEKTREYIEKFDQLYREKRVFDGGPKLQSDLELQALLPQLYESFGEDIRHHAKLPPGGTVKGSVLYNAGQLVSLQIECTVYYGWYDNDTQMCTYIGSSDVC